jgi:hypothetical protein
VFNRVTLSGSILLNNVPDLLLAEKYFLTNVSSFLNDAAKSSGCIPCLVVVTQILNDATGVVLAKASSNSRRTAQTFSTARVEYDAEGSADMVKRITSAQYDSFMNALQALHSVFSPSTL